ncbi:MAG: DUF1254 domain-containing protein [Rhizobiales bacterium]|nr:DUF1254 domain-containing protein [Hyphomicrobiales bacterium]NRB13404.1 DUF1254 domain-containing protein [Hyphomicrobiales bacterium]
MKYIRAIILLLISAIITHLAVVVYWPSPVSDSTYMRVTASFEPNKFYILKDGFGDDILQFDSHDLLYGICHYELNDEALVVKADINDGFGILAVYSEFGEILFSINSRQTLLSEINVALLPVDAVNNLPDGMVFHRVASNKGMIIIRLALSEKAYTEKVENQLMGATCEPVKF